MRIADYCHCIPTSLTRSNKPTVGPQIPQFRDIPDMLTLGLTELTHNTETAALLNECHLHYFFIAAFVELNGRADSLVQITH
ncbi:hypothetical protein DdX_09462 [Ditylenchus destructor]|uniref:Uncharacterized protein n=1 Tax=Ditylenchus destructor TaxID=166010 RepID=A0AAD4N4T0_9BILA|nr:hypothetical protein DdX_09462 [Ditylenchus destructor]